VVLACLRREEDSTQTFYEMLDKIKHKNLFVFVVEVCFDGTENDERVDN